MDYADPKRKNNFVGKILLAATLTALCIVMLKKSPSFNTPSPVTPSLSMTSISIYLIAVIPLFYKRSCWLSDLSWSLSSEASGVVLFCCIV